MQQTDHVWLIPFYSWVVTRAWFLLNGKQLKILFSLIKYIEHCYIAFVYIAQIFSSKLINNNRISNWINQSRVRDRCLGNFQKFCMSHVNIYVYVFFAAIFTNKCDLIDANFQRLFMRQQIGHVLLMCNCVVRITLCCLCCMHIASDRSLSIFLFLRNKCCKTI